MVVAWTIFIEPSEADASLQSLFHLICHSHLPPIPNSFEHHTPSCASLYLYYPMQLQGLHSIELFV